VEGVRSQLWTVIARTARNTYFMRARRNANDQAQTLWLGVKSEWVFDSGCKRGLPSGGVCRRPGLSTDSNSTEKLSAIAEPERNQPPMSTLIHFIGVDVHKESGGATLWKP
jgi:hypothetical protein